MNVVFDTTVLIDILRGHRPAADYASGLSEVAFCSEVSRTEVIRGLRSAERTAADRLFRAMRWVAIDEPIARRAGELGRRWDRHRPRIAVADLLIAATALELEGSVATASVRHFPMFADIETPYRTH